MGELLADHTTLRLGGLADRFLTHADPAAWSDLVRAASGSDTAPFVLGVRSCEIDRHVKPSPLGTETNTCSSVWVSTL